MKTKRNKLLSLVLSFALLLSSVSGMTFYQDAAAETASKIIVYVAAEGTNASGASVTIDKTPVFVTEGSTAKDAIQTVLDKTYPDNYTITSNDWGGSLDAIGELAMPADYSTYWNFCVNGEMASLGIGSYELQDQDQISLLYGSESTECSCYQNNTSLKPDYNAQESLLADAKAQQALLAEKIYETTLSNGDYIPSLEDTSSLYLIYFLAQSGFAADEYYTSVVNTIVSQYTTIQQGGSIPSTIYNPGTEITAEYLDTNAYAISNYCKTALCLAALGQDITNVAGINLVEKITNRQIYNAATSDTALTRDTLILFTMNTAGTAWPETADTIPQAEIVNTIVNNVDTQIENCISWNSFDSAAMIIQALSYYTGTTDPAIDKESLTTKCNQVIGLLSNIQSSDGSFISYGSSNPWTLAQIMVTAGLFDINPLDDERFIKNGKTLFDVSATFVDTENQTVDPQLIGEYAFQPEQLLAGLTACIRSAKLTQKPDDTQTQQTTKPNGNQTANSNNQTGSQQGGNTPGQTAQKPAKPVIKKLTSSKKKTLTVSFAKAKHAKKYKVQIATDKKFKKKVQTKTVNSVKKVTFRKLRSGKKYYVRIRAINGKKQSKWSKVKSKKIK